MDTGYWRGDVRKTIPTKTMALKSLNHGGRAAVEHVCKCRSNSASLSFAKIKYTYTYELHKSVARTEVEVEATFVHVSGYFFFPLAKSVLQLIAMRLALRQLPRPTERMSNLEQSPAAHISTKLPCPSFSNFAHTYTKVNCNCNS